jgi:hypothetical protein
VETGQQKGESLMSDEPRELPPHRLWQPTTAKWFAVVFGASLAYAVIRYHFAGCNIPEPVFISGLKRHFLRF